MKIKIPKVLNTELKKNILKLFSATLISQVTAISSSFILAYFFFPADLGEFSVVISLSAILSIFFTLRTEYPIVINSGKSNFSSFYAMFITLGIFITTTVVIGSFFIFKERVFGISFNLFLITVTIALCISYVKILQSYLVSKTRFGNIGVSKVLQVISILFSQIMLFKFNINKPLILGLLIGLSINIFYLFFIFIKTAHFYNTKRIISNLGMYIYKFKKIIGIGSISDVINSTASNMLPPLILLAFSKEIAGYYFFANRLLSVPLQLISSSSASVYFQKGSEYFKKTQFLSLKRLTLKLEFWNGLIMLGVIAVIGLFLPDILHLFFGNKWDTSLMYIYILLPFFFVRSLFSPISNIMEILNRNEIGLYLNIFLIIMNFLAIKYGDFNNNILSAIMIISITGFVGYLSINFIFLFFITKLTQQKNE